MNPSLGAPSAASMPRTVPRTDPDTGRQARLLAVRPQRKRVANDGDQPLAASEEGAGIR
jgi:hypothetical protein